MTIPTDEEIGVASKGIDDDGPHGRRDERAHDAGAEAHALRQDHRPDVVDGGARCRDQLADEQSVEALRPLLMAAMVSGLNYGLRIGEARTAKEPGPQPAALEEMSFVGRGWARDEHGSGVVGIKQAQSAAGLIPIVATRRAKVEKFQLQFEAQAKRYGKRIRFCRFAYAETLRETENGT